MALPPEIAGHLNLDGEPVTPRPSATVLLVRDGDPWELLLVHRPGGADFAPGAYVFPGGTVHEDDRLFEDECRAAAMRELSLVRQRDGAMYWGLFRDGADPSRYTEIFLVESWAEHLRQHTRVVIADRAVEQPVHAFHIGDRPVVSHLISAYAAKS